MQRKYFALTLALLLLLSALLASCGGNAADGHETQPDGTGTTPPESPSLAETVPPTEAPTETPTEPVTDPPVLHTVSFVNNVFEKIPPITVSEGEKLDPKAIPLPEGTTLTEKNKACLIPAGQTFDGTYEHYEVCDLTEYIITEDVTMALKLDLETYELTDLSDTSLINYYGRDHITDDKVTFLNTASGFEVRFVGRTLTAVFTRRGPGPVDGSAINPPTLLRLRVYTDGDMSVENSRVVTLDAKTDGRPVVLAEFAEDGVHTVLIRKMNYDWWGYAELIALGCDGAFCKAPARPEKKLLVYGDSITVGFGVEYPAVGGVGGDVPEKEDGTRAWAVLLADHYGAEITAYCNSGVSIGVPCWREKAIMDEEYFRQYAYFDTGSRYDMTSYVPDLILCNLGTNDGGGLANGVSSFGNGTAFAPANHYKASDLQKAYADFITEMKALYPDAPIVFCYGMMGTSGDVNTAIRNAVRACGFDDVYYYNFKTVECSQNAGHPTLAGQIDGYQQLLAFMEKKNVTF